MNTYTAQCTCGQKVSIESSSKPEKFSLVRTEHGAGVFPLKCNKCGERVSYSDFQ